MSLFSLFGCSSNNFESDLIGFSYDISGDSTGGHESIIIKIYDEENVLLSTSKASWHNENSKVEEYFVSIDILKQIKEIFDKHKMHKWNNEQLSELEICDGPTYTYSFNFNDGSDICISSQSFLETYDNKLNEINTLINKYIASSNLLPGLISINNEENSDIRLEVYEYCQDYLYYRIYNNFDEDINIKKVLRLYKDNVDNLIYEEDIVCDTFEGFIKLNSRLDVGTYILVIDDYEVKFEIA